MEDVGERIMAAVKKVEAVKAAERKIAEAFDRGEQASRAAKRKPKG